MALSYTEYQMVQQDLMTYRSREASYQIAVIQAYKERDGARARGDEAAAQAAEAKAAKKEEMLALTREDIAKAEAQVAEFNNQPAVKPESTYATEQKYASADAILPSDPVTDMPAMSNPGQVAQFGQRSVPGVNFGAMPPSQPKVAINVTDVTGRKMGRDLRVRIKVPPNYLVNRVTGLAGELAVNNHHGIIFPYTPSINVEYKAEYTTQTPLHSNFPINFYQKSSIGAISISGKFSVENTKDAAVYLSTLHLLKALTKMRSGGSQTGDPDSGSPPPVCRLFAHGEWMFENVPIAITNFRVELSEGVDYFTMQDNNKYEMTSVPTVSTISITCLPMYSRSEILDFNVTDYLSNETGYNRRGFL